MTTDVIPATLRDASYVMHNLQPSDRVEVDCQVQPGTSYTDLAYGMLMNGDNFVARINEQPVAFFGTAPMNAAALTIWALGTERMRKAIPAINDHMFDHIHDRHRQGYLTMEARAYCENWGARRWIEAMGGHPSGDPYEFGRDGELFLTFRWTRHDIERITRKRRSRP